VGFHRPLRPHLAQEPSMLIYVVGGVVAVVLLVYLFVALLAPERF
jgi:K+-transporting ATPase KdpF subunit